MLGLGAFTAVFAGAVVFAYQAGPTSKTGARDSETIAVSAETPIMGHPTSSSPIASQRDLVEGNGSMASQHIGRANVRFEACGDIRVNCIVDGDTFWFEGQKIRIADIDTPEISQPQCQQEYDKGMIAKDRLTQLLNAGPFELRFAGERNQDTYGRQLRLVVRDEKSIGDQLVAEGLAHRWIGHKQPWC